MAPAATPAAMPAATIARHRPRGPASEVALVVGCGALAREILGLLAALAAPVRLVCLPAKLHNRPERLPAALDRAIRAGRAAGHDRILVAYADCGTGGGIDRVCADHGVERLPGPHCYAAYATRPAFDALMEEEPGTFFLTDYLVRHFETLIVRGLRLDRHPILRDLLFANYHRVVYLAQTDDAELRARARAAAERLGLALEIRQTGLGELAGFVARAAPDAVAAG